MIVRYVCDCHGCMTATVDTERRKVTLRSEGMAPSECRLGLVVGKALGPRGGDPTPDAPVGEWRLDLPDAPPPCRVRRIE